MTSPRQEVMARLDAHQPEPSRPATHALTLPSPRPHPT